MPAPPAGACNSNEMAVANYRIAGSEPEFGTSDKGGIFVELEVEADFTFVIP